MAQPVSQNEQTEDDFQTEQVLTVTFGHFTHDTSSAFYAPLIPLLQEKLSLSYGAVGTLAMLMQLPSFLTPFIGYIADRVSVRYFVIFAPAVTATIMCSLGLAPSFLSLAFLLLAAGLSVAAFHAPAPAMVGHISGSRIGMGMGFFMAGGELGRTLGPLAVAGGVAWFGLEGLWRLMFVGWAVSLFLFFRLRDVQAVQRVKRSFPWQKGIRLFSVLAWLMLTRAFMVGAITTFLPTYMSDVVKSSFWLAAASLTVLEAAGVVGVLLSGTLSDRLGRRFVLAFLLSLSPFILIAFLYSPAWALVPLLLLLGFTALSTTPIYLAIVQETFPNDRALANGIFMALGSILVALAVAFTGALADSLGLQTAFLIMAIIALLALPALYWLP